MLYEHRNPFVSRGGMVHVFNGRENETRIFPIFIYININTPEIQLTTWGHDDYDAFVCLGKAFLSI